MSSVRIDGPAEQARRDRADQVVPAALGRVGRVAEAGGHRRALAAGRCPTAVSTVTRIASLIATSPPEIRNGSLSGIWRWVSTTRSIGSVASSWHPPSRHRPSRESRLGRVLAHSAVALDLITQLPGLSAGWNRAKDCPRRGRLARLPVIVTGPASTRVPVESVNSP